MRLLKYWSGPRCCGFWRWPRRERSADIRRDLGLASNEGQRQNQRNPGGREAEGQLAASLVRYPAAAGRGCTSFAPCHPPFCLYARPIPVFQQSPKVKIKSFVAAFAVLALLGLLPIAKADIPGLTLTDTIDPSPGTDAYALQWFQLNHSTHKLYTSGWPTNNDRNLGLKVIDTISGRVLKGIDLGRYTGDPNWFTPLGFAIDESAAPQGNKIYMVGQANVINARLRVIDGASDTNLTGEGTDLFLPVDFGDGSFEGMAVNSANHKVYIVKYNGDVVVVDGPNRRVLTTLHPDAGNLIIANPAANKIFITNHNGGGVIDSSNDTFTQLALPFQAFDAVLNPANGRIYFAGTMQSGSYGVFAVDGNTGQLITSRTGIPETPKSITFVTADNTVRIGTRILSPMGIWISSIQAFDGTDLSPRGSLAQNAFKLAYDPMAANGLFLLRDYQIPEDLQNRVGALDISTGALRGIATGYRPFEVAINSRANRAYVTDEQTSEILVIDGTTHAVVSRIPVVPTFSGADPLLDPVIRHVAVSERLNRVYLLRTSYDSSAQAYRSFLDVIDGGTNQIRGSIALDPTIGYYSDRVAVDDTRRRIYVTAARFVGTFSRQVMLVVYDADTQLPITTVDLGLSFPSGTLFGIAANPVTGRVYVSIESGLAIVDGNTNTKVGMVSSARGEIAVNRRTNKIYTGGNSGLAVINGATDSLETTFPIQDSAVAFDVDEIKNRVYVAHAGQYPQLGGRITAYDANNSYHFLGQIDLDAKPAGVTFASATRQLFVSHDLDGVISVLQDAAPAAADLFGNISTRARVGEGDNVLIGGFIITGTQPKTVIVRGIGPSLPMPGALADPVLEVHGSSGELLATNDNWIDAATRQQIIDSGLAPTNDLESALWGIINPGAYTVVVRDKNNAPGIGLFEVYDLDLAPPGKLINISTRGHVDSGDNVMIAGVIIVGSNPVQVVLRAMGPSLARSGVPNPLEDPLLELRDTNGGLITSNDNWQEHEAEVTATLLAPTDPRESAIVARLYPANYTAIVRGKNGTTGVALVEAYYLSIGQ
jgi:DNA-binding beta-propeller fold protein YncE